MVAHAWATPAAVELAWFALVAIASVVWATGTVRLSRRSSTGVALRRGPTALGGLGWVTLLAALSPPLEALSGELFAAHMLQHELLMVVAVPLLVLARPLAPLLWGLPPAVRSGAAAVVRMCRVRSAAAALTAPLVATALHGAAIWLWHVPAAYDAALASSALHVLQHAGFALTAALFWSAVLAARPRGTARVAAPLYVLVTLLHTTALGALLTLSPSVIYDAYRASTHAHGLTPLQDQQLGGLLMWVPAGMAYVAAGVALVGRCLSHPPQPAGGLHR